MGSLTLPIIDFSKDNLKPGSTSWIQRQTEVRRALEEFGCFHAHTDTVPLEAHKKMYAAMQELFNLPKETKAKNIHELSPVTGYMEYPGGETTGIIDPVALENVESFTNLMWPEGNPSFCETTYSYIHGLVKLEQILRRMVFESFGLEKYYESAYYYFRVNVGRPQVDQSKGIIAHTDKGLLSILHQNGVNGLQVQTRDGQWISLTPSPSTFTVLVGDSFEAWSNGRLRSAPHRVVLNGTDTRYSLVLFSNPSGIVEAAKELVDEEHPLLFKPFHIMDKLELLNSSFYTQNLHVPSSCT